MGTSACGFPNQLFAAFGAGWVGVNRHRSPPTLGGSLQPGKSRPRLPSPGQVRCDQAAF
jgi:hypothetical protein